MNNTHLDQARAWARDNIDDFYEGERVYAVCEVIQSLPDQWVDAEKVQAMIDNYKHARDSNAEGTEGWVINHLMVSNLESLIAPSLPTLYELMVKQKKNPEEYRWMQAKAFHTGEQGCVTDFDLYREIATVIFPNGVMKNVPWEEVTPLPDLPRLEWPAQEPRNPETPPAETLNNASSDTPRNPRPEDVPAREPWQVLSKSRRAIGYRRNDLGTRIPWVITYQGCMEFDYCYDSDITLVSRLVPEVKP